MTIEHISYRHNKKESFNKCFELANSEPKSSNYAKWKFTLKNDISTRVYSTGRESINQVVLPMYYRNKAMDIAHNNPFAGHLGSAKTKDRVLYQFYWPDFTQSIKDFVYLVRYIKYVTKRKTS